MHQYVSFVIYNCAVSSLIDIIQNRLDEPGLMSSKLDNITDCSQIG